MDDIGLFTKEQMEVVDAVAEQTKAVQDAVQSADHNLKVYRINEVHFLNGNYNKPGCCRIGLFSGECEWHGEGNFCGWYGAEFYLNATLLAYYEIENGYMYSPKGHKHLDEVVVEQHYDKIGMGSCYWEILMYAENDTEARSKFFAEAFGR